MNKLSKDIQQLWCDVLKIEECNPQDNFFDLGGNSLQVIKILNALDKKFGLEIEIESIYDELSLASLTNVALNLQKNSTLV
ncbi:hypothetical protein A9Q81_09905 [Gammaproteobacteria bacterium 42_54_T18]|nr:hypothetical protein A9Q81_09905 [Gammaproteobacteria bacterium 42_54_T18]